MTNQLDNLTKICGGTLRELLVLNEQVGHVISS